MQYQASQYKFLLLLNIPLPISLSSGELINVKTPNLVEYYSNTDLRKLEALLLTDVNEIIPQMLGSIADNYSELMISVKISGVETELLEQFEIMTGCSVEKNGVFYNGVELSEDDMLEIRAALLIATGKMKLDGKLEGEEKEETELERKMREAEERVNQLKKTMTGKEEGRKVSAEEMIYLLVYELDMSIEDIRNLNYFGLVNFFDLSQRVPNDIISRIAAGNGMLNEKNSYKGILD